MSHSRDKRPPYPGWSSILAIAAIVHTAVATACTGEQIYTPEVTLNLPTLALPGSPLEESPASVITLHPAVTPTAWLAELLPTVETPTLQVFPPTQASPTPPPSPTPVSDNPQGKIVFVCQIFRDDHRDQLCLTDADGSDQRRLTSDDFGDYNYPSFSLDGASVLYAGNEGEGFQIYELNLSSGAVDPADLCSGRGLCPGALPG